MAFGKAINQHVKVSSLYPSPYYCLARINSITRDDARYCADVLICLTFESSNPLIQLLFILSFSQQGKQTTTLRTTTTTTTTTSSTTRSPTPPNRRIYPSVVSQPRRPESTTSTQRPSTARTNAYTRFTSNSSRKPSTSSPSLYSSSVSSSSPSPPSSVYVSTSNPTSSTGHRGTSTVSSKRPYIGSASNEDEDNEIPDSLMVSRSNIKTSASPKLNMGGIIALGVFGGFVFLAAITTIIIIIFRRCVWTIYAVYAWISLNLFYCRGSWDTYIVPFARWM